jgi:hypothetical protein
MDQKAFLLLFVLQMQQSLRKMKVKDGEEAQLYHKKGMEQQASYLIKGSS